MILGNSSDFVSGGSFLKTSSLPFVRVSASAGRLAYMILCDLCSTERALVITVGSVVWTALALCPSELNGSYIALSCSKLSSLFECFSFTSLPSSSILNPWLWRSADFVLLRRCSLPSAASL